MPPALSELWWVSVLIGGPALIAVLWEKHQKRKAKKFSDVMYTTFQWDEFGRVIKTGEIPLADAIALQRQKRKDDITFKTVEEYRNGTD